MQFPNLMNIAGLGPKQPTPESKKYASFNRRMLAAAIDFAIAGVLVAPVVDRLIALFKPAPSVDMDALRIQMEQMANEQERVRLYWHTMTEAGALEHMAQATAIQFAVLFVLIGICWHYWSATPGKMLMRVKIVDARTEAPISGAQAILRLGGYMISAAFLLAGFFWIGIDKKKQGWHDKFADTVVITLPWRRATPTIQAADRSGSREPSEGA